MTSRRMILETLATSRARIVAAADARRRTIERAIHDGAQQRLVACAVGLRLASDALDDRASAATLIDTLARDIADAAGQLRELARDIYPSLLADAGLAPALRSAAERRGAQVVVGRVSAGIDDDAAAVLYFAVLEVYEQLAGVPSEIEVAGAEVTVRASTTVGPEMASAIRRSAESAGAEVTIEPAGDAATTISVRAIPNQPAAPDGEIADITASLHRVAVVANRQRRQIERALHDGPQQRVTALSIALRLAGEVAGSDPETARTLLEQAGAELASALDELRSIARGIFPSMLTDAGLVPAMQSLASRSAIPVGMTTHLDGRLPAATEAALYFACAEAIENANRHSKASRIEVDLHSHEGAIHIHITDNGIGMSPGVTSTGIAHIGDRLAALGGSLEVTSEPGSGVRLSGKVPAP